ncbi:MAG: tRNA uridine-5-carboxymethylaminomethyl(34) synthesis GTPase MnmE [Spongiibacteraceae bacterium]|jgi:tRNA modification GTPase|nr:tRNA uridine-5-carboxymethylaminomethyl(34) synthesis GTPase MnmE [Spongiibacteraceae bacterium]
MVTPPDTIAAIATPPGRGGVGIIRISGPLALSIGQRITDRTLQPRYAHYGPFFQLAADQTQQPDQRVVLDQGIALFFPAPHSFTGEDVVELQGHGGPVVLDLLLRQVLAAGARLARPGEFTERAYLNDKIDLAQAEAIADLIDSASEQAARSAMRSLAGAFSAAVETLAQQMLQLRLFVEAAIDFPEEEIDFLSDSRISNGVAELIEAVTALQANARQGALLRDGITVVIAGRPNAGKSSLLNALAGEERAIVTAIAGTTRDVLREQILIDGMPLHIIDTAGLRDSPDEVEQEGIRRAWQEIARADHILLVVDASETDEPVALETLWPADAPVPLPTRNVTLVLNKCDLTGAEPASQPGQPHRITLSARSGAGIDLLRDHLKESVGYGGAGEGTFSARRRHLDALQRARQALEHGALQLTMHGAGELLAEDLRQAHRALGEITGQVTADDLLGHIFSSFCIGK